MFAAYVSDRGHAFVDRRLYLPENWTDAPARLAAAHVPSAVGVAADRPFSSWGKRPAVSGTAEEIAAKLPASAYTRLSAGEGTEGPQSYDQAYPEPAEFDAEAEGHPGSHDLRTRGLLVRRNLADRKSAFLATWCPKGTAVEASVRVEGHRWAVEDASETVETGLGLDHNGTRDRHRHVSPAMLAFITPAVAHHRASGGVPPPKGFPIERRHRRSAGPSRRSGPSPAG